MVISTCLPVNSGGRFVGVMCIDLLLADLVGDMDSFIYGENSYAFLIDTNGRTLVHPLLPEVCY